MTLYGELSNGETLRFPLNKSESWKQTLIKLPRKSNVNLLKLGVDVSGDGKGHLGEIVLYRTKTKRLPTPQLEIEVFEDDEKAEAYVHFKNGSKAEYHSIYSIQPNGAKVWLGKTLSKDYYIAQVPVHNGQVTLQVTPIALDGTVGKSVIKNFKISLRSFSSLFPCSKPSLVTDQSGRLCEPLYWHFKFWHHKSRSYRGPGHGKCFAIQCGGATEPSIGKG
jgi:hypothetical protein